MNWGYWNGPRRFANNKPIKSSRLIPDSRARPQPEYIPKPVRDDYDEACRISDLSPKAAATLARRCLQGMIRDFCGISERSLALEVRKLRELAENDNAPRGVSFESIEAIDHVRKIGNIGAHMERDVNTIIDIDADEANQLIGLIEMLFHEWYTAHHLREERLDNLKKLAANKLRIREENTNQIDPAVDDDQVENKDL
ncbi:MAG: DUF4145 domain-containing protein [Rubellimicrobium sp.]|nr:DUF4145 domain-containing protein [Rubellimicrobium sp.]